MEEKIDSRTIIARIRVCMDEIADNTGMKRNMMMCALSQLVDILEESMTAQEKETEKLHAQIKELEQALDIDDGEEKDGSEED